MGTPPREATASIRSRHWYLEEAQGVWAAEWGSSDLSLDRVSMEGL
jgi:hypothetical protein